MAHLMPVELWSITFGHLHYKELRRCMLVNTFFQKLASNPALRGTLFRGIVISTLTSYYQFLTSMYLPESMIRYPPEEGWTVHRKYLKGRKTDSALEMMRHLPYLSSGIKRQHRCPIDSSNCCILSVCPAVIYVEKPDVKLPSAV